MEKNVYSSDIDDFNTNDEIRMQEVSGNYVDPFAKPGQNHYMKSQTPKIRYELIFWIVFLALSAWCVADRFVQNLWPLGFSFPMLSESLPGVPIPGTVLFFDVFGRATGRLFLTVLNALFWTQCKTTENFLMEHHPRWVELGDMRTIQNKTHYILGMFFMAIPMLIHCLCTFLPPMGGSGLTVSQLRPLTRVTPFIFFNNGSVSMFMSFDDIFRLVLVIVVFCFLLPFSISNYARTRYWNVAQWLHIFGAALFTIDMIRRSPHSQVFNTPVIAYFLGDRLLGIVWYRTGYASIIHKELLDSEYMVVFLYVPKQKRRRMVGSTYYLTLKGIEGAFEMAHPFVAFQNHSGQPLLPEWRNRDATSGTHKFYIDRSAGERKAFSRRDSQRLNEDQVRQQMEEMDRVSEGIASESEDTVFFSNWNSAFVIQLHEWNRNKVSFTSRLSRKDLGAKISFWGPYLTEYSELTPDGRHEIPPTVIIGTGAGAGPILDFYTHFTANGYELPNPCTVYFSTNSIGLFQFVTDLTCSKAIKNWSVNAHLTKYDDFEKDFEGDEQEASRDTHGSTRDMKLGRLSFMEVLKGAPKDTEVFFCGAPALQWKVEVATATYGLAYHPGHRFSGRGGISCHRVGTCKFVCRCTKFPLCLVY